MTREQLKEAIDSGTLYAADVTDTSAYVYFEPTGKEHEHAAHYRKVDGVWTWENSIHGDLDDAVGGEAAEAAMLELLGLRDE